MHEKYVLYKGIFILYAKNKKRRKKKEDQKKIHCSRNVYIFVFQQDFPEQMLLFIDFLWSGHLNQYF